MDTSEKERVVKQDLANSIQETPVQTLPIVNATLWLVPQIWSPVVYQNRLQYQRPCQRVQLAPTWQQPPLDLQMDL